MRTSSKFGTAESKATTKTAPVTSAELVSERRARAAAKTGSSEEGKKALRSVRTGIVRPRRAMIKVPPGVLGRMVIRSCGVESVLRCKSKSAERRSVISSEEPMGMSARAFLIQKSSMAGRAASPNKVQAQGLRKTRRTMPPTRKVIKIMAMRTMWKVL